MMIDKMYAVMDTACEKASEFTGVSIRFPRATKRVWKMSAALNGSIGIGLLLFGFLSSHKWVLLLGALGIMGSAITGKQAKQKD